MPSKSTPPKTHEECLELVCAVCTNLNGAKASRPVKKSEVNLIKKHVFAGYLEDSIWFPRGICTTCARRLYDIEKQDKEDPEKKKVNPRLPDDYICDVPVQTRSKAGTVCSCRWCSLARLNGLEFRRWQTGLRKVSHPAVTFICGDCGRGVLASVSSHKCSVTDQERVQALVKSLPAEVKGKLTAALLKEQLSADGPSTSTLSLPQAQGGKPLEVNVGHLPAPTQVNPLTVKEVQVMAGKAHLTGAQQESMLADLRSKFGTKVVESGMKKALPAHNRQYAESFTVEEKIFLDTKENPLKKHLYYCHAPHKFLGAVDKERGRD